MNLQKKIAIGVFFSFSLLWLFAANTDWGAVFAALNQVQIPWLLLSLVFATSIHFARVQRWSYIIRAAQATSFRSIFSAAQIGFLFNVMLPLRLGEVIRMVVLARLTKFRHSKCAVLIALDRSADIVGLLAVLFVVLLSFPTEQGVVLAPGTFNNVNPISVSGAVLVPVAKTLTGIICGVTLIFLAVHANQEKVLRILDSSLNLLPSRIVGRFRILVVNVAEGMHVFRSRTDILKCLSFSLMAWGCGTLSLTCVMKAFALDFPWNTPFVMIAMLAVSVSAPITPGLVGQFHIPILACVVMMVPEATVAQAKAVALLAHLVTLLPVVIFGIFCMFLERKSISGITMRINAPV